MKPLNLIAFTLLLGSVPAAKSQTFTVAKIQFSHPGPYSQAQLETAAGNDFHCGGPGRCGKAPGRYGLLQRGGHKDGTGRVNAITVIFDITPLDRLQIYTRHLRTWSG